MTTCRSISNNEEDGNNDGDVSPNDTNNDVSPSPVVNCDGSPSHRNHCRRGSSSSVSPFSDLAASRRRRHLVTSSPGDPTSGSQRRRRRVSSNVAAAGRLSASSSVVDFDDTRSRSVVRLPRRIVTSSKRHVVRMTLSVIVAFVVSWTPYFVVSLIRVYTDYRVKLSSRNAPVEVGAHLYSAAL